MKTKVKEINRIETNGHKESVIELVEKTRKKSFKAKEGDLATPYQIQQIKIAYFNVRVEGDSPLIINHFNAKTEQQILDKHMGKAAQPKGDKDPVELFKDSLYRNGKGELCAKAEWFKHGAIFVADQGDFKKTQLRARFHTVGDLYPIIAPALKNPITEDDKIYWKKIKEETAQGASMRRDMVRVGMNKPDVRFRAQFVKWAIDIKIAYNTSVISADQIINLINLAGFGSGCGEWRPQKNGSFGMYHVV